MENAVNSVNIRGFTKNGRCYTFEEVEKKRKGKTKEEEGIGERNIKASVQKALEKIKLITKEKVEEFLKLVNQSEYNIVE